MTDYHVPKRRVSARANLLGAGERHWQVFLSDVAETHAGAERPSDLLNRKSRFLGIVDAEDGFTIVSTPHICSVTVDAEHEFGGDSLSTEDLAAALAVNVNVDVLLENATEVHGTLVYIQPEGQQRLQDFLNQTSDFIALRDGTHAHIVNTARIVRIRASEEQLGSSADDSDALFAES